MNRLSLAFSLFLFMSLSAGCGTVGVHNIAILTIRQDNTQMRSNAELLPVAQVLGDRFAQGSWEFASDCSELGVRAAFRPGERYYVYHRGKLLGQVSSGEYRVGTYYCAGLCVMHTDAKFHVPEGAARDDRIIFNQRGPLDEALACTLEMVYSECSEPRDAGHFSSKCLSDKAKISLWK
jgi:hypothetical protein